MSSEQTAAQGPASQGRRRRAHKRSRKGCITCKQRHIRCDEQKPVCTNCLVRGGDCGYIEPSSGSGSGSAATSASGSRLSIETARSIERYGQQLSRILPATTADPFDTLPIEMPHRSMELFHHYTHYRIFSRCLVPKNPNGTCVGIAMRGPGTFRACLLLAAMHYAWMEGSLSTMEETYLYHKVEAMRLVNEQIVDPTLSTSDGCINTITALALTESSIGDIEAAETHLNALHTLLNIWRPNEWQHRFHGLIQRGALIAGSFISAAKSFDDEDIERHQASQPPADQPERPQYIRPTGPLFCWGPFQPTDLSPFYMGSPPDIEACKSDAESVVLINALRRLSFLPVTTGQMGFRDSGGSYEGSRQTTPDRRELRPSPPLSPNQAAILLRDADSYTASLLFRPDPTNYSSVSGMSLTRSPSPTDSFPVDPALQPLSRSHSHSGSEAHRSPAPELQLNPSLDPYPDLDTAIFPPTSRAWASAAYLYIHFVLKQLWAPPRPVDMNLLRLLLDKLRESIIRTEEAMKMGTHSRNMWLWSVMLGGYAVSGIRIMPAASRAASMAAHSGMQHGVWGVGERGEFDLQRRALSVSTGTSGGLTVPTLAHPMARPSSRDRQVLYDEMEITRRQLRRARGQPSDEEDEEEDEDDEDDDDEFDTEGRDSQYSTLNAAQFASAWQPSPRRETVPEMRAWFEERLGVWSRVTHVTAWEEAKRALLHVAWLKVFDDEAVVRQMWENGVRYAGMVSPLAALDPSLG